MAYDHQEYPKWRFHATQAAFIVQDKNEHDILTPDEEGWTSELKDLVAKDSFLGRKRRVAPKDPAPAPLTSSD